MLGSIYIGLSGMDAYSAGLQVISNNVANLNTLGFKADTVTFEDLVGDTGASGLADHGSGARQESVGEGVRVNSALKDFSQGTLQQSSGNLDLALQGSGFLVVQNANSTYFTRTGQFQVDSSGNISLKGTQDHLMILDPATGKAVVANVNQHAVIPPKPTTTIAFGNNLSSGATSATVSNMTVYDSAGASHVWTASFAAGGTAGQWTVTVKDGTGATVGTGTLSFNGSVPDPAASTISVPLTGGGSVKLDFSNVTSFSSGSTSTLSAASIDGSPLGNFTGVSVDSNGMVQLAFSNNQTTALGAVAVADIGDPQELQDVGQGMYQTPAGAFYRLVQSGAGGMGSVQTNQLEQSNVDLTKQFGQLILIQRGFQASSQVVSVTNDMIQQLFGMRGQA